MPPPPQSSSRLGSSGSSSSALQQHRQAPSKTSTGGYLRSPFAVTMSSHIDSSSTSAIRHKEGVSDAAGGGSRVWTRAGVGAHKLTAKERLDQLNEAKEIYGSSDTAVITTTHTHKKHQEKEASTVTLAGTEAAPIAGHVEANDTEGNTGLSSASTVASTTATTSQQPATAHTHQGHHQHHLSTTTSTHENTYVHRTTMEKRMLPKLLPQGLHRGGQQQSSSKRERVEDNPDIAKDEISLRPAQQRVPDQTKPSTIATSQQQQQPMSSRAAMEAKRHQALFGVGKKRR